MYVHIKLCKMETEIFAHYAKRQQNISNVLEITFPFGSRIDTVYLKTWWLICMVAFCSCILCIRLTRLVVNVIVNRIDIQKVSAQRFIVQYTITFLFTHLGRYKMATVFQTTFSNVFSFMERFVPFYNKSAAVQVMAWRRTGDKPWPESKFAEINDAWMWH